MRTVFVLAHCVLLTCKQISDLSLPVRIDSSGALSRPAGFHVLCQLLAFICLPGWTPAMVVGGYGELHCLCIVCDYAFCASFQSFFVRRVGFGVLRGAVAFIICAQCVIASCVRGSTISISAGMGPGVGGGGDCFFNFVTFLSGNVVELLSARMGVLRSSTLVFGGWLRAVVSLLLWDWQI